MKRVARPSPAKARALALAAIRETFEESGLLLGAPATEIPAVPKGPWEAFAQAKILPDLQRLYFIGRAITPPGRTRRFDARFFSLDASAIAHRIEGVTGPEAELVELVWMSLPDAKQLDLPAVTSVMLDELELRRPMASATTCRCRSTECRSGSSYARCSDRAAHHHSLTLSPRGLPSAPKQLVEVSHGEGHHHQGKLVSSADTGFYYVTRKNSRTMTDKLVKKKYDPVAKKHVEFREGKIK